MLKLLKKIIHKEFEITTFESILYLFLLRWYYKKCSEKGKYVKLFRLTKFSQKLLNFNEVITNAKEQVEKYYIPVISPSCYMFQKSKVLGYISELTYLQVVGEAWNNKPLCVENITNWFEPNNYITLEQYEHYNDVIKFNELFGEILNHRQNTALNKK